MKNGWWEHTPEWQRRRQQLEEAHERFRGKARYLGRLEDEGIVRGQMWEHANRQFWTAGREVSTLHRKLWEWERRMGRTYSAKGRSEHARRIELNEKRKEAS